MRHIRPLLISIAISIALSFLGVQSVFAFSFPQDKQNCVYMSDELKIPEDGTWLNICFPDSGSPENSSITEANVKLVLNHSAPAQLEIQLSRTNSDLIKKISPLGIDKEGIILSTQIHEFDGLPSQGEWIVRIRNKKTAVYGSVRGLSIYTLYTPDEKMAQFIPNDDGKPTSMRLAPDSEKIIVIEKNKDKKEGSSFLDGKAYSSYFVPILTETFEGSFPPASGWSIYDANPNDGKQYFWDDDNLKPSSGNWAAWPARGGANGIDPVATTTYPANMDTWMIFGPFDLSNAKSANAAFMLWRNTETTFDNIFFGISGDGVNFTGSNWNGKHDYWESKTFSLSPYLGDNTVWIGWRFSSDGSIQKTGPWIDDIMLNFEPGDVNVSGNFTYDDRSNVMRGAKGVKVQLWDQDLNGDDLLGETFADGNGNFSFPAVRNWDLDDPDPNPNNRRLDVYVLWKTETNFILVAPAVIPPVNDVAYSWISSIYYNVSMGMKTINGSLPYDSSKAIWLFEDTLRSREFFLSNTSPQVDPGFLRIYWSENQNYGDNLPYGSHFWAPVRPHAFIAHASLESPDIIVHEIAHHIMWNKTGLWLWYDFECFDHGIFSQESTQCGWSEGWADFISIAVNGDVCYDFGKGPCDGVLDFRTFNLENHTRNDPNAFNSYWGDGVEGRVAGALFDLMDSGNEVPWYDTAFWGFDPIMDSTIAGMDNSSFSDFWNDYQGTDKHNGVRAIYQNTIDYDQAPIFIGIPNQNMIQNLSYSHLLNLWNYSSDAESPIASLTYQIVYISDSRCGITLDSHWINASPQMNWHGNCYVDIQASDSIKATTARINLNVLQINSRIFLPIIIK